MNERLRISNLVGGMHLLLMLLLLPEVASPSRFKQDFIHNSDGIKNRRILSVKSIINNLNSFGISGSILKQVKQFITFITNVISMSPKQQSLHDHHYISVTKEYRYTYAFYDPS